MNSSSYVGLIFKVNGRKINALIRTVQQNRAKNQRYLQCPSAVYLGGGYSILNR